MVLVRAGTGEPRKSLVCQRAMQFLLFAQHNEADPTGRSGGSTTPTSHVWTAAAYAACALRVAAWCRGSRLRALRAGSAWQRAAKDLCGPRAPLLACSLFNACSFRRSKPPHS